MNNVEFIIDIISFILIIDINKFKVIFFIWVMYIFVFIFILIIVDLLLRNVVMEIIKKKLV